MGSDPKEFADKVAVVTGAASGIGRASALAFAARGAKVVVSDVQVDGGEATVAKIKKSGGDAMFVRADVSVRALARGCCRSAQALRTNRLRGNNAPRRRRWRADGVDGGEGLGPHDRSTQRRLALHEVRDPPDAPERRRRSRQHGVDRGTGGFAASRYAASKTDRRADGRRRSNTLGRPADQRVSA
jgi:hypothetical protein